MVLSWPSGAGTETTPRTKAPPKPNRLP